MPSIGAESSRSIIEINDFQVMGVVSQVFCGAIAHIPYADEVVRRGGYQKTAIRREIEGADRGRVCFESVPNIFRVYFPDLEDYNQLAIRCSEKRLTEMPLYPGPVARYFPSRLKHTALIMSLSASRFLRTLNPANKSKISDITIEDPPN